MSADNWAECPICAKAFPLTPPEYEFREDYEFYLDTRAEPPVVRYHYEGRCRICGSGTKFEGSHPIEVKAPK